jgi:hypothetical protein
MVGTLWKAIGSESGICVCTKYKDGFYTLTYLDDPQCFAHISESSLRFYYTQLTQPTEDT